MFAYIWKKYNYVFGMKMHNISVGIWMKWLKWLACTQECTWWVHSKYMPAFSNVDKHIIVSIYFSRSEKSKIHKGKCICI